MDALPGPYPAYEYGFCNCGGTFEPRYVEVRLTVRDEYVVLSDVPQGGCANCGSNVYKAEVLEMIEAIFYGELPLHTAPDSAPAVSTD